MAQHVYRYVLPLWGGRVIRLVARMVAHLVRVHAQPGSDVPVVASAAVCVVANRVSEIDIQTNSGIVGSSGTLHQFAGGPSRSTTGGRRCNRPGESDGTWLVRLQRRKG